MIVIVNNGKGAEEISRIIRGSKIVKPPAIPSEADAYILSDGVVSKEVEKYNIALINRNKNKPILGIGAGYIYLGMAFGAKAKASSCAKNNKITIKARSPLFLDLKKIISVVDEQKQTLANIPEEFIGIASCGKNEFEIIQHGNPELEMEPLPFFGVHFNPELGLDGFMVLKNFERFVEIWAKYHK